MGDVRRKRKGELDLADCKLIEFVNEKQPFV
jgi:hypothetical protein